jgi:hypothetical protein
MRQHEGNELANFGVFWTDRMTYAPLQEAHVTFERRGGTEPEYLIEVYDGAGQVYWSETVPAPGGVAEFVVTVGGVPGTHIIRAFISDQPSFYPDRMGSFLLVPETTACAEGTDLEAFFVWLRDSLATSAERSLYHGQWVWGDKAADNSPMNLAYPRFRLDASVYFETAEQLKQQLDLIYAHQKPDGSLYDHIYGDGHPGWDGAWVLRSMMADLEIGSIINVHQVWLATGDAEWLAGLVEPMLRGWRSATSSPELWDEEHGLIKRPHTADEWDVQTGDGSCFRNEITRDVIATCDAIRLPKAADALAEMLDALGRGAEAGELREFAAAARQRGNALLWDGVKYQHHVHLDGVEHPDFDEQAQLAMSNTWACNEGLADHEQAVSIIEEYERRLAATGDRYPWWSLQPGYPEGWFPQYAPGVYVNGGLFPWVGGELCRACFGHGFAARGWRLFREFWEQVKADRGALVTWYTLDGRAAANTAWTTNYDAWGIGAWGRAAIEALVGVKPLAPAMARCQCTLHWAAGDISQARACVALPASHSYFAYRLLGDESGLQVQFTGSGEQVEFRIPVPAGAHWQTATLDGAPLPVTEETRDGVSWLSFTADISGVNTLCLMP